MKNQLLDLMTVSVQLILAVVVNGFVFQKGWEWFITPALEVQPISTAQAMGIVMMINAFVKHASTDDRKAAKESNVMDMK
ncbi:hypothetical protein UFOVP350_30 [uncultured Caudovirales phage]|uniref:Uncharacterized protein n=1 Tax=uncultured Caudovirales phage TaxID=2100421 RepID=A0A6J5M0V4_9CAUD|nr:hypothetical protein UFOVP350_30 [uncultured Caudovirales phage]